MNTQAEYMEQQLAEARARIAALEVEKARGFVSDALKGCAIVMRGLSVLDKEEIQSDDAEIWLEDEHGRDGGYSFSITEYAGKCADILEAALAAPAPAERVEQEAVAWRVSHPRDGWQTYDSYPKWAEGDDSLSIQPLYTAPHPSPAPAALDSAHQLPISGGQIAGVTGTPFCNAAPAAPDEPYTDEDSAQSPELAEAIRAREESVCLVHGLTTALKQIKRIAAHPPKDRAILEIAEAALTHQRKEG